MPKLKKVTVIGGDERCRICANLFAQSGCECATYGLEKSVNDCCATKCMTASDALGESDVLILPLPATTDSTHIYAPLSDKKILISEITESVEPDTIVFAGNPCKYLTATFENSGMKNEIVNFAKDEVFQISGSISTSEGALQKAIGVTGKTINGSKILVCGNGRIGKYLSDILKALGADVYVSARKESDLAWISAKGKKQIKTSEIKDCPVAFDMIFNTVPAEIFDNNTLNSLKGAPVLFELASKPYGIDFSAAANLGIKVIKAPGLPGITAPIDAGEAMYTCICRHLSERGYI